MVWLAGALWLVGGCASSPPSAPGPEAKSAAPRPGQVLAWDRPTPLDHEELARVLAGAQVVIVGETHDHPGHHAAQLKILKLMAREKGPLVVGVEWLDHGAQPACDALSAGTISVDEFAKRADWKRRWGYPLALYRPILELVRRRRLKLVALNAPLEVVRKVARQGLEALTPAERARLAPSLDLEDPEYEKLVARQFQGHGAEGRQAQQNFLAAQIARDETMAHHLAQALAPWPDGGKKAVVLAGSAHLAHGRGLPPRIARRLPGVKLITFLPVSADNLTEARPSPHQSRGPADYLMVTPPAPPRPPRLGILVRPVAGGLLVEGVWPQGAAGKAGMKKGDILVSVDGGPIKTAKDIHNLIKAAPYAPHRYLVRRSGKELVLSITLADPSK